MKKAFLITPILFLSLFSFAQLNTTAIDSIFVDWNNTNSPGCALGIFEKGEIIYSKGYGSANLEYSIPNSSNSVFRIGSTSKQFTAACIVLLEQQGKLKFENTLTEYFPDFPDYADQITIRHLLNHTSGLRDYLTLSYLKGLGDDDFYTDEDVMRWMINQQDLNFEPGEEFVYCNSGYWLLGQIVNEVTGVSMAEFTDQEIFAPLGMKNTHFHDDHTEIVPNRASGYQPESENTYSISMTTLEMIGDGGIFTTIEDIKLWDDAYYKSSVLNSDFWKEMTHQGELNNGEALDYASGLFIGSYEGLKTIRHGGAFVGFRAELLRFPEHQITIAIFANRADANPSGRANDVADVILSDYFMDDISRMEIETIKKESLIETETIKEKALERASFVGAYEIQPGMSLTVSIVNDSVHVFQSWNESEYTIERSQGNTFILPDAENLLFRFMELEDGFTQILEVNQEGRITECTRKAIFDESEINFNEYIGVYYSQELEVEYSISMGESGLQVSINEMEAMEITPDSIDRFYGDGGVLHFLREKGTISGFKLDAGRVKNLRFEKE